MALSPEDVVSKRFTITRFRDGYDLDEVDDFLDEVVVEIRRLTAENEELKKQLEASPDAAPVTAGSDAPAAESVPEPTPEPEPSPEPVAVAAPQPAPVTTSDNSASQSNALLQLAQRVYDEHVAEGESTRTRLIAEGTETRERLIREGTETNERLIREGTETKERLIDEGQTIRTETLEKFSIERANLEKELSDLRAFEKEYRKSLKAYFEGQLRELTVSGERGGVLAAPISANESISSRGDSAPSIPGIDG